MNTCLLEGEVIWTFDHDLEVHEPRRTLAGFFSFNALPQSGGGHAVLTPTEILGSGSDGLRIPLASISQLYLGFDELYPASSVKNFGAFWQPLRIKYSTSDNPESAVYLVTDYNGIFTSNQIWYDTLVRLTSDI